MDGGCYTWELELLLLALETLWKNQAGLRSVLHDVADAHVPVFQP